MCDAVLRADEPDYGSSFSPDAAPPSLLQRAHSQLEFADRYLFAGLLISSGFWRGKARFAVLGAGVAGIIAMMGVRARDERIAPQLEPLDWDGPFAQTADTLLLHAIKEKATALRLSRLAYGLGIEHRIEGEWRPQPWQQHPHFPLECSRELRREFMARAQRGDIQISEFHTNYYQKAFALTPDEVGARFSAQFLNEPHAEILLTRL